MHENNIVKYGKPGAPLINLVLMVTSNCKNLYTVVNRAAYQIIDMESFCIDQSVLILLLFPF